MQTDSTTNSPNSYLQALRQSYQNAGNNICLGIDPQWQKLPQAYRKTLGHNSHAHNHTYAIAPDTSALQDFLETSLGQLTGQKLSPAAFKPNLGYFQTLDRPLLANSDDAQERQQAFAGSRLLVWLYYYLSREFPNIPIILDFKKGDIARSSANYAEEGFALWRSDAVTVSPYMGSDSVSPFGLELRQHLANNAPENSQSQSCGHSLSCQLPYGYGGVYSLLRTSNPGGRDLQNLELYDPDKKTSGQILYMILAHTLLQWCQDQQIPGLGAVVGATSLNELSHLAQFFADQKFPLLIPGVGKQGGSFRDVQKTLQHAGYPLELARINLSSGLLQSWDGEAPENWPQLISRRMEELL